MPKVQLIAHTPNPQQIVAAAYKICYSASDAENILSGLTPDATQDFLEKVAGFGHESPVEHASFTFAIEGVSRSLMAQITRHRIASFSVQSQRYVKENDFTYITPPEIAKNPQAQAAFANAMEQAGAAYNQLRELLTQSNAQRLESEGVPPKEARAQALKLANEDARFVLPNACETKMIATFNVRSLFNFFKLRCCNRAQWEIQALAWDMLALCLEAAPLLFEKAGPACLCGPCTEGSMSCGKAASIRARHEAMSTLANQ